MKTVWCVQGLLFTSYFSTTTEQRSLLRPYTPLLTAPGQEVTWQLEAEAGMWKGTWVDRRHTESAGLNSEIWSREMVFHNLHTANRTVHKEEVRNLVQWTHHVQTQWALTCRRSLPAPSLLCTRTSVTPPQGSLCSTACPVLQRHRRTSSELTLRRPMKSTNFRNGADSAAVQDEPQSMKKFWSENGNQQPEQIGPESKGHTSLPTESHTDQTQEPFNKDQLSQTALDFNRLSPNESDRTNLDQLTYWLAHSAWDRQGWLVGYLWSWGHQLPVSPKWRLSPNQSGPERKRCKRFKNNHWVVLISTERRSEDLQGQNLNQGRHIPDCNSPVVGARC